MMRECGPCTECCRVGGVPELDKPAHTPCKYQGDGCTIFSSPSRPSVCKDFRCTWLHGVGPDDGRPDLSGVMISANDLNGGMWLFAIELRPDALRSAKSMVEAAVRSAALPMIVVDYGKRPPHDTGDRVVLRSDLISRSRAIAGKRQRDLADGIAVHKLKVGP